MAYARSEEFLPEEGKPLEEHHLVALVRYAAYIVVRYGEVYAPTFERLERELEEMRRRHKSIDRARKLLELPEGRFDR